MQKSVPYSKHGQEKIKKHESTTRAIRNAGFRSKLKVKPFNVLLGELKLKYYENPHYG